MAIKFYNFSPWLHVFPVRGRRCLRVVKTDQFGRILQGFFLLGLLGLFFCFEGTHPLHPRLSSNSRQVSPLRGHFGLQDTLLAVVDQSDGYDANGEWNCLLGPSIKCLEPGDHTAVSEPKRFRRANRIAVSLLITRSPPDPIL